MTMKKRNMRLIATFCLVAVLMLAMTTVGFCTGTANESVTNAFTSLKADVIATLGVVAALAVGVMGVFLAWKYGRKIFSQVAK